MPTEIGTKTYMHHTPGACTLSSPRPTRNLYPPLHDLLHPHAFLSMDNRDDQRAKQDTTSPQRLNQKRDSRLLAGLVDELEGVHTKAVHVSVVLGDTHIVQQECELRQNNTEVSHSMCKQCTALPHLPAALKFSHSMSKQCIALPHLPAALKLSQKASNEARTYSTDESPSPPATNC